MSDHTDSVDWDDPVDEFEEYGKYPNDGKMRTFESGATRDSDEGKIEPGKYLDPQVIRRFCEFMLEHAEQADGTRRAGDNWRNGIPRDAYFQSLSRHYLDLWDMHVWLQDDAFDGLREDTVFQKELEDTLCAVMFNTMGYLYEWLQGR